MSLDRFIRTADNLVEFEASLNEKNIPMTSIHSIEIHREELKSLWEKIKTSYETCLTDIESEEHGGDIDEGDNISGEISTVKSKYWSAYGTYCRCGAKLRECEQQLSTPKEKEEVISNPIQHSGFKLPPCDIPTFNGNYSLWPTFRDIFKAACVHNPRLSPVEKLFHLHQKNNG